MNQPAPQLKSVELYNRVINLVVEDDADEIAQIMWQLKSLVKQSPTDFAAGVALVEASLMCGERQPAVAEIEVLWNIRYAGESEALVTYVQQLMGVGGFDRGKVLIKELMRENSDQYAELLVDLAVGCAFFSGDIAWLDKLCEVNLGKENKAQIFGDFKYLKESGFAKHLFKHQEIVRRVVFGKQTSINFGARKESESSFCWSNLISVPAPRRERRTLESNIDDALKEYYASVGLPATFYLDYLNTTIVSGYLQVHRNK